MRLVDDFLEVLRETELLESPINVRFKKQLELIQDSGKRRKVEDMLRRQSTRNIKEPASSTGKYHPNYAHGEYGLSRHVKAVVAFSVDICKAFPELPQDVMVIAALMHDIVKYVGDGKHTTKDHAKQAADMLREAGLEEESKLVASHMGRWDAERGTAPRPTTEAEKFLHLADYLASRQWISIDFDEDDNIVESNLDTRIIKNSEFDEVFRKAKEYDMITWDEETPF